MCFSHAAGAWDETWSSFILLLYSISRGGEQTNDMRVTQLNSIERDNRQWLQAHIGIKIPAKTPLKVSAKAVNELSEVKYTLKI